MDRRADGRLLPENAQSTRPEDACLSGINKDRLHEKETDSIRLHDQARKPFNHTDLVTAVTDGDNLTLVMCSYSAGSIFEFATSFSSGEIQVDSRPSLNRANFPGRSPNTKKLRSAEAGSQQRAPSRSKATSFSRRYPMQQAPRPDSQFNYLKTATSAFQVYLLPAANALNQQPQPSC